VGAVGCLLVVAGLSATVLLVVMPRFGLLAGMVALIVHSIPEASVLTWDLLRRHGSTVWFPLALVLFRAGVGIARAPGGRGLVHQRAA
jgi:hypothetical protein